MKLVLDIEANSLYTPTRIWLVVCKDVMTGFRHIFKDLTNNEKDRVALLQLLNQAEVVIGHNILGYDLPVMAKLLGQSYFPSVDRTLDTFIVSKCVDYPRVGHGVADYGLEFGIPKGDFEDFSRYSDEMLTYCIRDVDITEKIYLKYKKYIDNKEHHSSLLREHRFQLIVNDLHNHGFALDIKKCKSLLDRVLQELHSLDTSIQEAFPPRLRQVREVIPKETKYGTISLTSIPKSLRSIISDLTVGAPFTYCEWVDFNPASPKQVVELLNESGWHPTEKTKTHVEVEREINRSRRQRVKNQELEDRYSKLQITGWKINEANLTTLPSTAPESARLLARRILFEDRRKKLTEWLSLVKDDGRVHGQFQGIGAWTHRMAHQKPNMANISNAVRVSDGKPALLGRELRSSWIAPKGRLLVGVDAESIQLRVFAHLINDPVLINSIVSGNKKEGTDAHSLNKKYFGEYCKTRNAAKHSLYAMFFGGRAGKIAEIMDCNRGEAQEAIDALVLKYPGLQKLQQDVFPRDARRGYFIGLDGRKVKIPGETVKDREHLCMSGYLQNGEKVIMAEATIGFHDELKDYDSFLVDLVHDEWQNECPNDMETCVAVAELECNALVKAGKDLGLNCPMAGSYRNDEGQYTFGKNWYQTH